MKKSFYYLVPKDRSFAVSFKLNERSIPYALERKGKQSAFVFPDLPVGQYNVVRQLFGGDHWHPYPS